MVILLYNPILGEKHCHASNGSLALLICAAVHSVTILWRLWIQYCFCTHSLT